MDTLITWVRIPTFAKTQSFFKFVFFLTSTAFPSKPSKWGKYWGQGQISQTSTDGRCGSVTHKTGGTRWNLGPFAPENNGGFPPSQLFSQGLCCLRRSTWWQQTVQELKILPAFICQQLSTEQGGSDENKSRAGQHENNNHGNWSQWKRGARQGFFWGYISLHNTASYIEHLAGWSYWLMIDWEILKEGNEHKTRSVPPSKWIYYCSLPHHAATFPT